MVEKFKMVEAVPSYLCAVLLEGLGGVAWPRRIPEDRLL